MNRKDFIYKLFRISLLTAMIAFIGILLEKKKIRLEGCADDQGCANCPKLSKCNLPLAKKIRNDAGK